MVRGALIVVEGGDRCGKSSHCTRLAKRLSDMNIVAANRSFPDRSTQTGKMINDYLKGNVQLDDRVIHLLFSANRWEAASQLKQDLMNGKTLIVDRYAYSGVAFSAAKGLPLDWCKYPDVGLPQPDVVIFMDVPPEDAALRDGFGNERYEKLDFQKKVYLTFKKLEDPTWKCVDASKDPDAVHEEIFSIYESIRTQVRQDSDIKELWK
ncbi:hypothetical protein HK098_000791 [Nowakowskiella sp. JEL0407]|nr:hypothetical protein HK098_000791 [Nowakowskiella sp. JEL0407]